MGITVIKYRWNPMRGEEYSCLIDNDFYVQYWDRDFYIVNCPTNMGPREVMSRFIQTIINTKRFRFDYKELGRNKLILE